MRKAKGPSVGARARPARALLPDIWVAGTLEALGPAGRDYLSPIAGVLPAVVRAPGHGPPCRTERPGTGLEGGILMAQAGAAPTGLGRRRPSRGGNARGSRGRAGAANRGGGGALPAAKGPGGAACGHAPACKDL